MNETTPSPAAAEPPTGATGATGPAEPTDRTGPAGPAGGWAPPVPPPPPLPGPPPVTGMDSFFDAVRRSGVVRSDERWIGGVGGGLALRLGVDPLVTRGVLAASVLLGGIGFIAYAVGWLLLPEQRDGRIHLQQLFRGDFDSAVLGGFALLVAGISFPDRWAPGLWWRGDAGWWDALVWIAVAALVVVLVVSAANRSTGRGPGGPGMPPGWPAPSGPTGPTGAPGPVPPPVPSSPSSPSSPPSASAAAAASGPWPASGTAYASPAAAPPRPRPEGPTTTMYRTAAPGTPPVPPVPPQAAAWPQQQAYPQQAFPQQAWQQQAWQQGPQAAPTGPPAGPVTSLQRTAPRGPGAGALGTVVALSLLTLAGLLYADRVGTFDGPVALTAGAVAVTLLGLAIIVSGLRGRTAGGLGALAVVLTLALVPLAAMDRYVWDGDWDASWDGGTAVGDIDAAPTTVDEAEAGYAVGAGSVRIDLTEVPLDPSGTVDVPIEVGAGDVTVVLPQGTPVDAEVSVMAGEVRWLEDEVTRGTPGTDGALTFATDAVDAGTDAELHLDITVGAGTVRVEEQP